MVEASLLFKAEDADRFEDAQGADPVGVGSVFGGFEGNRHVGHGRQVVDFVRLHLLDDADQVGGVGEIAVVEDEVAVFHVRILVEVVDAVGVEERRAAFHAVDDVAFF